MLTNEAGEVTSHLQGMFSRTIRLLEAGLKPIYCNLADFAYPYYIRYSKRADATVDLAAAIETGDTVKVTKQHNEDCKKLLKLMGVPVIVAASEAEAECAALCKNGKVYIVASVDMDSLTFGVPRFLRHLMDPSSRKVPVIEFEVAKVLEVLNLTMDQFIDLCILCGYQIPESWPYQEARHLFKEPLVSTNDQQPEIKWSAPDEEGLINFLVNENGFNTDRVTKAIEKIKAAKNKSSQGRLESFFKPVVSASVPLKRKIPEKTAKETAKKKPKAGGGKK
ncbi:XPG/Rad2 endonuclease [Macleaya cordata]|uniref:XPG/Rad2 endonuclease n=1 Tax=Macleaya cordata TaxID=56857 RepID=A0A200Q6L5_MACCD|nr:XPG/Rad2 endonuclease [Macleaya cordata]